MLQLRPPILLLPLLFLLVGSVASAQEPLTELDAEYDALDVRSWSRPRYDRAELLREMRYPETARNNNLEGRVVLGVLVDTGGTVMRTRIEMTAGPVFDSTASHIIRRVKFRPGRIYGRPVRMWVQVPIDFRLQKLEQGAISAPNGGE